MSIDKIDFAMATKSLCVAALGWAGLELTEWTQWVTVATYESRAHVEDYDSLVNDLSEVAESMKENTGRLIETEKSVLIIAGELREEIAILQEQNRFIIEKNSNDN